MEKTLYVLGAGFSAPLGMPVISNFLGVSKDMFQNEPDRYKDFASIFDRIDRMGKAKNFIHCDLNNIEEILSIIEMESFVEGRDETTEFRKYIHDVITHCTPPLGLAEWAKTNPWHQVLFKCSNNADWSCFFAFVAMLFNLKFAVDTEHAITSTLGDTEPPKRYAIVSLNYDMVLENIAGVLSSQYGVPNMKFVETPTSKPYARDDGTISLAKLHGSVDPLTIVPPTWNKTRRGEIEPAWRLARQLIAEANHIVFIGYSLAPADRYFRYLIAAGVLGSQNLKSIGVVNNDHNAFGNYTALFNFSAMRHIGSDTLNFLKEQCLNNAGNKPTQGYHAGLCKYI